MHPILLHICSITEVCSTCPFRHDTADADALEVRALHLDEMSWDIMYRPACKSTPVDILDGKSPMCRGSAVYMVKNNRPNAALKAALEQGVVSVDDLMKEASIVID